MTPSSPRVSTALQPGLRAPLLALGAAAVLLATSHPAEAHGLAGGGVLGGLSHPLLGLDHLLLLLAVGMAASRISAQLLLWALGGAVLGAAIGGGGLSLPFAELLAALAISAVGALTLLAGKPGASTALTRLSGVVVAAGLALHGLLHGLEAPKDGSSLAWWGGALVSSALVCSGSVLIQRHLPGRWSRAAALAFVALGGLLAVGCLGLVAGGAAA